MSINLYDKAIISKLENWTRNTKVNIVGPSETRRLLEVIADKGNDKAIQLPFISLKHSGGYTIEPSGQGKRPLSFDGFTLEANYEEASQLNAIPISIPYQIDVYTRYFEEADEYTRNLVFNIVNYPKLSVIIPYNGRNYTHFANLRLSNEIEDNSDIPERLIAGQFTRMSLHIDVDDAYLWDVRYRDVYSICYEVVMDNDELKDDSKDKN